MGANGGTNTGNGGTTISGIGSNGGINNGQLNAAGVNSFAANTLQYSNGYVSFKAASTDAVVPHTHNAAQCAQHCQRSASCVAWTRVAGAHLFLPILLPLGCSSLRTL